MILSNTPAAPDEGRYRFLVLLASLTLALVGSGAMYLLIVILKPLAEEFGWPRATPSLAYSLQFFGGGIGGIVMGYWLDRAGMGLPALLCAVMIGSGAILLQHVANEWHLYLIYGLMLGLLGQGVLFTPLVANALRWFGRRGGAAVGFVAAGQTAAGVVWPPVFRHFNDTIGWRETSLWYGVFALAVMLPVSLVLWRQPARLTLSAPGRLRSATLAEAGVSSRLMMVCLCIAIVGCCTAMSMPLAHLVAFGSDMGFSSARAAEILSLMLAAAAVSRMVGVGVLADRFGGLRALFAFSAIQAVMLAMFGVVDSLVGLYLVAIIYGLGYGGVTPCYPVIIREYLPAHQVGGRTGIVLWFGTIGMALGGWLGGYVFDQSGSYVPAFLIGVGFNAVNLGVIAALIYRTRPSLGRLARA